MSENMTDLEGGMFPYVCKITKIKDETGDVKTFHVVGLDALRRRLPRMDGDLADVHLRVRKIFRHDLLDGKFLVFIDEMHEQPREHLPVAEYSLDERVPVRVVLPTQYIMPQGAEL